MNKIQLNNKFHRKKNPTTNKKQSAQNNSKPKESLINDKNDIDDLVRFIDGDETVTSTNTDNQTNSTTSTTNESTSKKNKKKKDKQSKTNNNEDTKTNVKKQNQPNTTQQTSSQQPSRSASSSSSTAKPVSNPSSSTPTVETPPTLSKRQRKAKLKLEQQQQQEKQEENKLDESETTSNTSVTTTTTTPKPTATTSSVTVPSSTSSPKISKIQTTVEKSFEHFDSPEEEVNWITISRKQSKHKPTPPTVPSLLATPVPPVIPPTNTKQHRPQSMATNTKKSTTTTTTATPTTNSSSLAQQKIIPSTTVTSSAALDTTSTMNKQPHTITAPPRLQNVLKNHSSNQTQKIEPIVQPSMNLWTNHNTNNNNIHEHNPVIPPPVVSSALPPTTIQPTASAYVPIHTPPSSSVVTPIPIVGSSSYSSSSSILSENLPSSIYWEPTDYLLPPLSQSGIVPSTVPGPVQRPNSSFSPAPGAVTNTTSRCIQRPSPEPRSCSTNSIPFPLYSPMNYAVGSSTSTWNDTSGTNNHESQWSYPKEQHIGSSSLRTDFPLYDPFHSGAGLTIPSTTQTTMLTNGFSEQFADLCAIPNNHDINEMDALDKEIEDFKRFCFENVPLETREKVQVLADRCFVRQA